MLCDRCEGYKLCSSHFPGSPRCRALLREHGWSPEYTNADRIRAMDDKELAELIREEQYNAVLLQRIESVPAILERLRRKSGGVVNATD